MTTAAATAETATCDQVAALRERAFDLLAHLRDAALAPCATGDVAVAATHMQNVANELGVIESLIARVQRAT